MTLNERITAVHIMQRFVRMSRVLLPIYASLIRKEELTCTERLKLKKINSVYQDMSFNPEASQYLINSNILELIIKVYSKLKENSGESPQSFCEFNKFIAESDRLIRTWNRQLMN